MCATLLRPWLTALITASCLALGLAVSIWPSQALRVTERIEAWQFNALPDLRRVLFLHIRYAAWIRQLRISRWLVRLQGVAVSFVGLLVGAFLVIGLLNSCP